MTTTSRLLKKAHLRRWRARALPAAYPEYASFGASRAALHLDLFEQPAGHGFLDSLPWQAADEGSDVCPRCPAAAGGVLPGSRARWRLGGVPARPFGNGAARRRASRAALYLELLSDVGKGKFFGTPLSGG